MPKNLAVEPKNIPNLKKPREGAPKKITRLHAPWWSRPVRPLTFFGISILMLVLVGGAGYWVYQETHRQVPERIPSRKLAEFQKKKATLASARRLQKAGRNVESVAVYDQYLKRYPYSTAAKQGRATAVAAIQKPAGKTSRARSAEAGTQPKSEQAKPSLRQKVRRIFRRPS